MQYAHFVVNASQIDGFYEKLDRQGQTYLEFPTEFFRIKQQSIRLFPFKD